MKKNKFKTLCFVSVFAIKMYIFFKEISEEAVKKG